MDEEGVETGFELKEGGDHFFVAGGVVDYLCPGVLDISLWKKYNGQEGKKRRGEGGKGERTAQIMTRRDKNRKRKSEERRKEDIGETLI